MRVRGGAGVPGVPDARAAAEALRGGGARGARDACRWSRTSRPTSRSSDILTPGPALAAELVRRPARDARPARPSARRARASALLDRRAAAADARRRARCGGRPSGSSAAASSRAAASTTTAARRLGLAPLPYVHTGLSRELTLVATLPQLEYPRAWPALAAGGRAAAVGAARRARRRRRRATARSCSSRPRRRRTRARAAARGARRARARAGAGDRDLQRPRARAAGRRARQRGARAVALLREDDARRATSSSCTAGTGRSPARSSRGCAVVVCPAAATWPRTPRASTGPASACGSRGGCSRPRTLAARGPARAGDGALRERAGEVARWAAAHDGATTAGEGSRLGGPRADGDATAEVSGRGRPLGGDTSRPHGAARSRPRLHRRAPAPRPRRPRRRDRAARRRRRLLEPSDRAAHARRAGAGVRRRRPIGRSTAGGSPRCAARSSSSRPRTSPAVLRESRGRRASRTARSRTTRCPPERFAELAEAVLAAARETPLTAAQLKRASAPRTGLNPVPSVLCREGRLVRVAHRSLRSNALSYQAVEVPRADPGRVAGLARGRVPAGVRPSTSGRLRVVDRCQARARAEAALATVETIDVGDGLLLRAADEAAFERARPYRGVDLLPEVGRADDGLGARRPRALPRPGVPRPALHAERRRARRRLRRRRSRWRRGTWPRGSTGGTRRGRSCGRRRRPRRLGCWRSRRADLKLGGWDSNPQRLRLTAEHSAIELPPTDMAAAQPERPAGILASPASTSAWQLAHSRRTFAPPPAPARRSGDALRRECKRLGRRIEVMELERAGEAVVAAHAAATSGLRHEPLLEPSPAPAHVLDPAALAPEATAGSGGDERREAVVPAGRIGDPGGPVDLRGVDRAREPTEAYLRSQ